MEEKNNKKGKLLYTLLGVTLLLALVGGAYAFFSASVSDNSISGQTQNISNGSLTLTVKKIVFTGVAAPTNDLVPAYFGHDNNDELVVGDPSALGQPQVANMLTNKCENDGFTGCHVYKITIQANQNITHANLLLNLSVSNLTGASNVVDKSQWGYVVFSGTETPNSSDNTKTDSITLGQNALNGAGHGGPAAIGNGVTALDIHSNSSLSTNSPVTYYLLVYVNDTGESQNTSTSGTGDEHYAVGTYSGSLELQALGGKVRTDFGPAAPVAPEGPTAAEYITSLYTEATKSTLKIHDGENEIDYHLASSVGLMNDRLGGTTTIDGGNIRYYGANPNNYVWLGDTYTSNVEYVDNDETVTLANAGDKKLWRIIGVFDGRLKLIQAYPIYPIGEFAWDDSDYGDGINQWGPSPADGTGYEGADLMRQLNPGFDNAENGSWYWNNGLSAEERSMIDTATWYLGAAENPYLIVNDMYNAERQSSVLGCSSDCDDNVTRLATWTGKVGLIYASDYGYATDLSVCHWEYDEYNSYIGLDEYNYDGCYDNDWLSEGYYGNLWTITPESSYPYYVLVVNPWGSIDANRTGDPASVRPVIYLNTNVMIDVSGDIDGSFEHPYELSLS